MQHRFFPLLVLATLGAGCGSQEPATPAGDEATISDMALVDIGEMYRVYSLENNAPPKSLQDVEPLSIGFSQGFSMLQRGEVVMTGWGVALPDLSEEAGVVESDEVLAYQKQVPDEGGLVLLLDRRIVEMTPEEFAAAPKAGNDPEAGTESE